MQEEGPFANVNNLEHCVKYLNQTLVAHGFPAPLELASHNPASIALTCNCVYALLRQRQHDLSFRESANDQRHRLFSDQSRLESRVERLEGQLAAKEREIASLVAKEQKVTAGFKAQLEKLQVERDEFQRMVVGSQQVRTQQLHELKKREKEFVKLQERLNQVLADRKKETRTGMEMMSSLHKEGRQRGTWNTKKADGEFYKMIVDAYETKKQELVAENAELRALLRSMQLDMKGFLNRDMTEVEGDERSGFDTPVCGRSDVFDLPLHMARERIQESLRSKMASIKEHVAHHRQVDEFHASERELEPEGQLVEARSTIEVQMNKHMMREKVCTEDEQDVRPHLLREDMPGQQLEKQLVDDCSLQEERTSWKSKLRTRGTVLSPLKMIPADA